MVVVNLENLVIPNGATASNIVGGRKFHWLEALMIHPPGAFSGVPTIEVSDKHPDVAVAADFTPLVQSDGVPVPLAVDEAIPISPVPFQSIRIVTTVAPGADETYKLTGQDRLEW